MRLTHDWSSACAGGTSVRRRRSAITAAQTLAPGDVSAGGSGDASSSELPMMIQQVSTLNPRGEITSVEISASVSTLVLNPKCKNTQITSMW